MQIYMENHINIPNNNNQYTNQHNYIPQSSIDKESPPNKIPKRKDLNINNQTNGAHDPRIYSTGFSGMDTDRTDISRVENIRKEKPTTTTNNQQPNVRMIKTNGKTRVATACNRCRSKKTKCDGGNPCSTCSAVGLECIVSDKLSRKAFPKGYTESLEERVRHLEAENRKLVGLLDMRDEQLEILNTNNSNSNSFNVDDTKNSIIVKDEHGSRITASNLNLLDQENSKELHMHDHDHENGCSCGCDHINAIHEQPVSIAGSIYELGGPASIAGSIKLSEDEDDDNDSLLSIDDLSQISSQYQPTASRHHFASNSTNRESTPAPGAFAAATAIAQMQKNKSFQKQQQQLEKETDKQRMLTSLVATSMPRSTEETLCVPTLLARICQAYGYDSKPSILAANTLASMKEHVIPKSPFNQSIQDELFKLIMNRDDIMKLNENESLRFLQDLVQFPISRLDMDQLITIYFQKWGNTLPILNKNKFLNSYMALIQILEGEANIQSPESTRKSYESIEKVGALIVLILSLGFLGNKNTYLKSENAQTYIALMKHYDFLIHEIIKPSCIITKYCSIQSLQILSLALQYCLAIGDMVTCYDLRGRVISMAQQLRLHRCPAAVLGLGSNNEGDLNFQNSMQAERRILFWCIYCLDTYSSLNLGVPRLMKDYEIECAMPFSGKKDDDANNGNANEVYDDDNVNILIVNNTQLSIVGKVSKMALSVMLFCKVLANILDSIYSRFDNGSDANRKALHRDRMLDCWRRELPNGLKFELDINGLSLKDSEGNHIEGNVWENCNNSQLILIYLYYHAKILIYLPIISKYGNHHNVGLSQKEQLSKGESDTTTIVSTMSLIQQSASQILEVIKSYSKLSNSSMIPIPLNIAREQALITLLVAKGTLDYIKGGPLFNNSKQLLLDSINDLSTESKSELPGTLSRNSTKLLELSILSILGVNLNKLTTTTVKKKPSLAQPIVKTAVEREPKHQNRTNGSTQPTPRQLQNSGFIKEEFLSTIIPNNNNTNINTNASSFENQNYQQDQDSNKNINYEDLENLESLLKFDPFSVTSSNNQMYMNDFVTDGSLGLVPFLDSDLNNDQFFQDMNNY
ncbi:CAT8 [Candida jiufengensis]|uniref:CAT8 n=1 Tax=Candida jiufengensis TaxID=497108 RepID=UPI00222461F6|nr:CAT8 [Candida jiufengensis]KAI5951942.1 CAT8 [Candida jiufengensis]